MAEPQEQHEHDQDSNNEKELVAPVPEDADAAKDAPAPDAKSPPPEAIARMAAPRERKGLTMRRIEQRKEETRILTMEVATWLFESIPDTVPADHGEALFDADEFRSGVAVCELVKKAAGGQVKIHFNGKAAPGSFLARDNLQNFINAALELGVHPIRKVEVEDVLKQYHKRGVVSFILSLARELFLRFKFKPPGIVSMGLELDRLREEEAKRLAGKEIVPHVEPSLDHKHYIAADGDEIDAWIAAYVNENQVPIVATPCKVPDTVGEYVFPCEEAPLQIYYICMVRGVPFARIGQDWEQFSDIIDRKMQAAFTAAAAGLPLVPHKEDASRHSQLDKDAILAGKGVRVSTTIKAPLGDVLKAVNHRQNEWLSQDYQDGDPFSVELLNGKHDIAIEHTHASAGEGSTEWAVRDSTAADWKDSKLFFFVNETKENAGETQVEFIHADVEGSENQQSWEHYVGTSLKALLETGVGQPYDGSDINNILRSDKGIHVQVQVSSSPVEVREAILAAEKSWWDNKTFPSETGTPVELATGAETDDSKGAGIAVMDVSKCENADWSDTKLVFQLTETASGGTDIHFVHHGMNDDKESYHDTVDGWNRAIGRDLVDALTKLPADMNIPLTEEEEKFLDEARQTDLSHIERDRVMYVAGRDRKHRSILVIVGSRLPPLDDQRVYHLLLYMALLLDKVARHPKGYVAVYCHTKASLSTKYLGFVREAKARLPRLFRKNIQALHIVHGSFALKSWLVMSRPFISSKFWRKLFYFRSTQTGDLEEVFRPVRLEDALPDFVVLWGKKTVSAGKLFGGTLERAHRRNADPDSEVPRVCEDTISYLRVCGGLDTEGLFRTPGRSKLVDQLVDLYEKDDDVRLFHMPNTADTHHAAASVLKRYIRELPTPLFPQRHYNKLMAIMEKHEDGEEASTCAAIAKELSAVPARNKHLLRYLFSFLAEVASDEHEDNRMTSQTLAVVWYPSILYIKDEDAQDVADKSKERCGFVSFCIENWSDCLLLPDAIDMDALGNQL